MLDVLTAAHDDEARLAAVRRRDAAADGTFLYSVATTGVYCHPSCAARPALRRNIAFHADRLEAERAGFRPCKRCRPDLPPRAEREATLVAAACRMIEAAEDAPSLATLAAEAAISPHHFHRMFRRVAGVTPKAYHAAHRQARMQASLAAGACVTEAIYEAGFNSSGRFYAAANAMLGMTASRYRAGGLGETIRHAVGCCSLGSVLVAATGRGVCAILLGDDAAALQADLRARFPKATLQDAGPDAEWLAEVVAFVDHPGSSDALALPLDIRGTVFQRRVWEVLRAIPPGETLSYAAVAARLGQPAAVRAVAGACAANALAVAVPCHRVVASTGALAGYRWGVERKRALLARERA
jgi:AraC family transcriptional regulator of adaptative response/methylated-DNA-[protein]-cysteine methyltransferase